MPEFPSDIEYEERGNGPAVLFLPGSFGTGSGWRPVIDKFGEGYRIVTTSLIGYGATSERRPLGNATMAQQTDAIDLILDRIAAPAHVVAHSYGGLCALAHAIEGRHAAASLTLVEANPFAILKTVGDDDRHQMFSAMTQIYFAEFEMGKADAARHVIDFYGGRGTFDAFPLKVRDYIMATTAANIRDWSSGASFAPPLSAYARITAPTVVIRGGNGHPAMLRIAELIAEQIPNATLHTINGGSHFLPATHASELVPLIKSAIAQMKPNDRGG